MGSPLQYDSLAEVRSRMAQVSPSLVHVDEVTGCPLGELALEDARANGESPMDASPFQRLVQNYYTTNPIARASVTMAKCTAEKAAKNCYSGTGVTL